MNDLNVLIPKIDKVEIRDRKTGKVFNLELFLNNAAGLVIMENLELFREAASGKINQDIVPFIDNLHECMFKPQYNFMDAKWCHDNIGLKDTLKIIVGIMGDVLEFLKTLGMVVTPGKKPGQDGSAGATII